MKKFFAMMLALCLVLTAFAALAEETTANEVNWSDVEATITEAGWEGDFVGFDEVAVKVWVPSAMTAAELTDEDKEGGYIGYYQNADGTALMQVVYVDVNGMSLEDYTAALPDAGATNIENGVINGLDVVTYAMAESDAQCVAFTTEAGYVLEFTFAPMSDESFSVVASAMMASIQAE